MSKVKKLLQNEKGVSLILVMLTLVILSLLGTAIATVSFANIKLTTNDREYQSTYYIAEAGVNQAYAQMKSEVVATYETRNNEESFYSAINNYISTELNNVTFENFEESFSEQPKANITIEQLNEQNPREYKITSEGVIGNRTRTVEKLIEVKWASKSTVPSFPSNAALIVRESVSLTGSAKINGDVHLSKGGDNTITLNGGGNIHQPDKSTKGTVYVNPDFTDTVLNVPTDHNYGGPSVIGSDAIYDIDRLNELLNISPSTTSNTIENIDISGNRDQEISLDSNSFIEEVSIKGNNNLDITIGEADYHLVVENLDLSQGDINIIGSGTLHLHVLDDFTIGGSSTINNNGNINQFNFYYYGNNNFELTGSQQIKGSLYVEEAPIDIGGSGAVDGGYILTGTTDLKISGGSHNNLVVLAPNATVTLGGGAEVNGAMIADKYEASGGNSINYRNVNMENFPFGGGDAGSNNDLIQQNPAKEVSN